MKCIFIYNPVGGKGVIAQKKDYIVSQLREKYEIVDVKATKERGDMVTLARDAVGKYDAIIFAGGDGSFNEVLQGIGEFEEQPTIGYIPSGTVNDVAHSLRIPKKLKKALKIIKAGNVEQIDCMKLNDRYAIYVVTAGAFTSATYNTPQLSKNHIGRIAYGLEGLKHNLKFEPFYVDCTNGDKIVQTDRCVLIAFINSRYVAGFGMNKRADLQDGKVDVAIVERATKKAGFFRTLASYWAVAKLFLFGYRSKIRHVVHFQGSAFDVAVGEDVVWNIDGEKGISGKIHIEILPKKVNIIVPSKKRKKNK